MKNKNKLIAFGAFAVAVCTGSGFAETILVKNGKNTGDGSLRQALQEARDGDRIVFDAEMGSASGVFSSALPVDANVEIDGSDVFSVSGYGFRVAAGKTVTFKNLVFKNCNKGYGAAVYTSGTSHFMNCSFLNGNTSASGGAVYNDAGKVHFRNCLFSGNSSGGYGGAIYSWKEGSECHVNDCTFINNRSTSAFGGAIYHQMGKTYVKNSRFEGNWANSYGGAIMCDDGVVLDSTFENNRSGSYGGAIMSDGGVIANCTFSGNQASVYGGAVLCWDTVIANCTAVGNSAGSTSGAWGVNQPGCWHINNIAVGNSSKAGKDVFNCLDSHLGYSVFGDLFGSYSSAEASTCRTGKTFSDVLGEMAAVEVDGVRQTYYPVKGGSPAENAGVFIWHNADWSSVAYSVEKDGTKTYMRGTEGAVLPLCRDQLGRRFKRPSMGSISLPRFQVYTNADSGEGSLRDAIANAEDGDTILFDLRTGMNEIRLESAIEIAKNRFSRKGLAIGGDNGGRCVKISGGGKVQLFVVGRGNKVFADGINFADGKALSGGAICNEGELTVRNCAFTGNCSSSWGGAIANMKAAAFYAENCDFVGNKCGAWGGAVASHTTPVSIVLNCRFSGNACEAWGGAVAAFETGNFLVIGCNVHDNEAHGGSLVAHSSAKLTLIGTTVKDNSAVLGEGSDIFNLGGSVKAFGSYSQDNEGGVAGETGLAPLPMEYSVLASTDTKALGAWYSQVTNSTTGTVSMRLNRKAIPGFAVRTESQSIFDVDEDNMVSMPVDNVKPFLYYGLGWSDTPGGEFTVEPGMWIQADANGTLPSDVKAPKGNGASRFFRIKVTDNPRL